MQLSQEKYKRDNGRRKEWWREHRGEDEERREEKSNGRGRKGVKKVLERQTRGERGKMEGKITESYSQKLLKFSASVWNTGNSRSLD